MSSKKLLIYVAIICSVAIVGAVTIRAYEKNKINNNVEEYIEDLEKEVQNNVSIYDDDIKIYEDVKIY